MRARRLVLLFWWFLLVGRHAPLVVGPFYDQSECDTIREELPSLGLKDNATTCWYDSEQDTLHK